MLGFSVGTVLAVTNNGHSNCVMNGQRSLHADMVNR